MGFTIFGGQTVPIQTQTITEVKTASALIYTGLCAFSGIVIRTNKVVDVIMNIYDGIDDTGKLLILPDFILNRKSTNNIWTLNYDPPIECLTGIYIDLSIPVGGSADYQIIYEEG